MGARAVHPGPADTRYQEVLGRLGLDERATAEDIARARNQLQAFLATAPRTLRGWARSQATAADEAYSLLSDPIAWRSDGALLDLHARSAAQPDGSATPPVRRAIPAAEPASAPTLTADGLAPTFDGDDDATFEAMLAELTPSMHRDRFDQRPDRALAPSATSVAAEIRGPSPSRGVPRVLLAITGVAAAVAIAFGVYQFGAPAAASVPAASPAASAGLDEARVAQLMAAIQQDPNDTAALLELGDAFFQAGDYQAAVTWLEKLVALDPANVRALLALGAAQFNIGDAQDAEARWKAVLALEVNNVEAHYDLGFLYLNAVPPDMEGVTREWTEVVNLAPGTDIANVVQQHLDALAAASGAPSAGPTEVPSAGASAAPTPGATVAPSASVAP